MRSTESPSATAPPSRSPSAQATRGAERAQRANRNRSAASANIEVHRPRREALMVTKGIIVRLKAKSGQEETVAGFLRDALPLVQQEPQTIAWFALRIDAS